MAVYRLKVRPEHWNNGQKPWPTWWDETSLFVVVAPDERAARQLCAIEDTRDEWLYDRYVKCVEVNPDGEPRIIARHEHAT